MSSTPPSTRALSIRESWKVAFVNKSANPLPAVIDHGQQCHRQHRAHQLTETDIGGENDALDRSIHPAVAEAHGRFLHARLGRIAPRAGLQNIFLAGAGL